MMATYVPHDTDGTRSDRLGNGKRVRHPLEYSPRHIMELSIVHHSAQMDIWILDGSLCRSGATCIYITTTMYII